MSKRKKKDSTWSDSFSFKVTLDLSCGYTLQFLLALAMQFRIFVAVKNCSVYHMKKGLK